MKIRSGFVSNSSSSSFIIHYKKNGPDGKPTFLISKEQRNKLKKYGFRYTNITNPYFVGTAVEKKGLELKDFEKWEEIYLSHDVICNQDDVIAFLIENKIPFVSLCHYDEEIVVWDGKTDHFYMATNPIEMLSRQNGSVTHDVGEESQYLPAQLCPKVSKFKIDPVKKTWNLTD